MNILLIQPPSSNPLLDQVYLFEPLALEYLAAGLLGDGHSVEILDARLDSDLDGALHRLRPRLVGLTGYTCHLNILQNLATRCKTFDPTLTVVVGGHHATVAPQDFNLPVFDAVAIGEGTTTLCELVRALEAGESFAAVDGLALPGDAGQHLTPARPWPELDSLPFPARELTARHRGRYASEWLKPLASLRTSLGCTARCNFCALWSLTGGRYLRRSVEQVVAELRTITEENVFFCDDESMCDARRMDQLADAIAAAGIRKRYFLYARVDTIVAHPELFRKWRDIGLLQVFVGMEDFADARLAALAKGTSVAQQEQAVRILNDLGVMMYASFMIDPDYSREDFRTLTAYVRQLKLKYATFSVLTPLPGTELFARRRNELISTRPEHFDMLHTLLPTRLPLPEFYAEYARVLQRAIPLRVALRNVLRFGWRHLGLRLRLLNTFLTRLRASWREYSEAP